MIGFENKTRIAVFLLIGVAATACATCLILAGITRMADANEQNAVDQRLRWSTIPASLKVEK